MDEMGLYFSFLIFLSDFGVKNPVTSQEEPNNFSYFQEEMT